MPRATLKLRGSTVTIETVFGEEARFVFQVDGRPARVRTRLSEKDESLPSLEPKVGAWSEGDDATSYVLARLLDSERTRRTDEDERVVFEVFTYGLSGTSWTSRATITLDPSNVVVVDLETIDHEINPHVGW